MHNQTLEEIKNDRTKYRQYDGANGRSDGRNKYITK